MHQRFVAQEHARHNQADEISRQDGLAFGGGRQPAQEKQDEENEFNLRLTHARRAHAHDDEFGPLGHEPEHEAGDDDKHQKPDVEVGEDETQRQHRAKVVDETGRQNHFAKGGFALARLDHDSIDHRHGGRGERDAGDLGLMQGPAENELREEPNAGKRQQKRRNADGHARPEVGPQRYRINLRSGQKRQHAAAQHGEEVRPVGGT